MISAVVRSSSSKAHRVNGERRSDLQPLSDGGVSMSLRLLDPFLGMSLSEGSLSDWSFENILADVVIYRSQDNVCRCFRGRINIDGAYG